MTNYIIRQILLIPILLFGVTVIIFGMLQFLGPVERSALYVKDFPKNDNQIQGIIKRYKLDRPDLRTILGYGSSGIKMH